MSDRHLRDPLYGNVKIRDAELPVLDSWPVQRLRYVGQLGDSQYVWPGATHTRFEHSVGVLHVASSIGESVGLDDEELLAVRIAGLLHDTGHGPFSHASDYIRNARSPVHEERSCAVIDRLDEEGTLPVDPEIVKEYVRSDAPLDIVAGTIDADRMDYIRRDAANTGVGKGAVDTLTITKYATVRDGRLAFREPALRSIEGLLTARFTLMEDLHRNEVTAITNAMLRRSLERYFEEHRDVDVLDHDDRTMHTELMDSDGDAGYYYRRLARRNLYKNVFDCGVDRLRRDALVDLADADATAMEREIAESAGVDSRDVVVNLPTIPDETAFDVAIAMESGDVRPLHEVSSFPETLRESEWRSVSVAVYAPEDHREAVREAASEAVARHARAEIDPARP
ncbi:hypothetical protein BRD17_00700 [Halobacteriales archaeon SW_7_68_16]|nr:MAG: hypothetical protein BRD17_00700 [Halobacteriales archaeon SW_7_68_16]